MGIWGHRPGNVLRALLSAGVVAALLTISGSFNHDCHDTTSGTGTAGSANTWASDTATTQNVVSLCVSGGANEVAD